MLKLKRQKQGLLIIKENLKQTEKNFTKNSKKQIEGIKNPKTKINETIKYSETEAKKIEILSKK